LFQELAAIGVVRVGRGLTMIGMGMGRKHAFSFGWEET
jgi:hypothetical protein